MNDDSKRSNEQTKERAVEVIKANLSDFSLIYESRDAKLCLFQDKEGHITAVRSEKLA